MIDLYYWPTPNGHKITLFLEEAGLPYRLTPVNIGKGEQFEPDFLDDRAQQPHAGDRRPRAGRRRRADLAVRDRARSCSTSPRRPAASSRGDLRGRAEVLQWLFWQMGGLGPMAGQNHHFTRLRAREDPLRDRALRQRDHRLYGVLDTRLADRAFIAGADYSIADMASYPWIVPHERQGQNLDRFPEPEALVRGDRRAAGTKSAYALAEIVNPQSASRWARRRRRCCSGKARGDCRNPPPSRGGATGHGFAAAFASVVKSAVCQPPPSAWTSATAAFWRSTCPWISARRAVERGRLRGHDVGVDRPCPA